MAPGGTIRFENGVIEVGATRDDLDQQECWADRCPLAPQQPRVGSTTDKTQSGIIGPPKKARFRAGSASLHRSPAPLRRGPAADAGGIASATRRVRPSLCAGFVSADEVINRRRSFLGGSHVGLT